MPRPVEPTDDAIAEAAARLRDGRVVAFPTETVYGLGADTFSVKAIDRVYALKGRSLDNPLIAHVLDEQQAGSVVAGWDDRCSRLAREFWPGPLTLVLPRAAAVPSEASAGWPTIAVRAPAHPVVRALLAAFGGSVSAPSANRSGHVSPTAAGHVADDFADAEDLLILDGGSCAVGIESTVLDLSGSMPTVLRPGAVSVETLRDQLGEIAVGDIAHQAASPGTTMRHYAPHTSAELVGPDELAGALRKLRVPAVVLCFEPGAVSAPHRVIAMPRAAESYAARLYEALREADALRPGRIIVERPPSSGGMWMAVQDRLRRATGGPGRPGT
ncbi:MAG: L-threonylcarbamoyladenylate synthase [Planctomycetota bacterium]|jgi:L-threonylcarbamoyladenylate synthase